MKNTLIVTAVLFAFSAQAATAKKAAKTTKSATIAAAVPNSTAVAAAPQVVAAESAAATSTATVSTDATTASKLSGALVILSSVAVTETLPGSESQTIGTANQVSMKYKLNGTTSVGTGIDFLYNYQKGVNNDVTFADPFVSMSQKTEATLAGSEKIGFGVRYYIPSSIPSINAQSLGKLRLDSELGWTLNPKWSVAYGISPRLSLSKVNAMNLQWIHYANASYNVSDETSVYGSLIGVSLIKNALNWNQAKLEQDDDTRAESIKLELGANFQVGKVTINPAFTENMKTRAAMNLGKADQQSYYLNLTAAF